MAQTAPLLPEVKKHYGDLKNYIGGEWRDSTTSHWLEDTNPATGQVIAHVPLSTKEYVDASVQAALGAWEAWRETVPLSRARYFFTLRDLMEQHFEDLSRVIVQDMGKTIDEARGEVRRAIENVEVAGGYPGYFVGPTLLDEVAPEMVVAKEAGNIGVNIGVAAPMAYFPFGGMKDSFFGDLHPQGRDAIRFFTEPKVVVSRWP